MRVDKKRTGLGACSGMAGFLCFLVSMVPPPGLLMLLRVLLTLVEVALGRYSSGMIGDWGPP